MYGWVYRHARQLAWIFAAAVSLAWGFLYLYYRDWRGALRAAGKRAGSRSHQGEVLNFESAGSFFGKLTERRWALVHASKLVDTVERE